MKKILFLGAGFLQSFVLKKAKDLGYYTLVVDSNVEAPGFKYADQVFNTNIFDHEACLVIARNHSVDGVIAPATDVGALTAAFIAGKLNLPSIDYDSAKLIRNKYQVRKLFHQNMIDDMRQFYEVNSLAEAELLKISINFPVIIKPADGSGSKATHRADNAEEFLLYSQAALNGSYINKALVEDYIAGKEYGVESFVYQNQVYVLGIMEKLMTSPPDYAELGHRIPSGLSPLVEGKIKKNVIRAIKVLGINHGSVNMDILVDSDHDVYIIDVGARMGGNMIGSHIIPNATQYDSPGNAIRAALGEPVELPINEQNSKSVATRIMSLSAGHIVGLPPVDTIADKMECTIYFNKTIGDQINTYHTNHDNCGFIVAAGEDLEKVDRRVSEALLQIDQSVVRALEL